MTRTPIKQLRVYLPKADETRDELKNALIVLKQAIEASNNFYKIYQRSRRGSMGTTSHGEQDLLRAMLVFSCSGLDAVIKQLIADALAKVVEKDRGAQHEFQKFVERRLKKSSLNDDKADLATLPTGTLDASLLASVLVQENPRVLLVELLKKTLSNDSLQSKDQLLRVGAHFAITKDQILKDENTTKEGFQIRNEIIHEMDVNLTGQKKRRQRTHDNMVKFSKNMLSIAGRFIEEVEKKLAVWS